MAFYPNYADIVHYYLSNYGIYHLLNTYVLGAGLKTLHVLSYFILITAL